MHDNLSRSHQQGWAVSLLLRKRASDTIHSTPADRSVCPYPVSLPRQSLKQWGQSEPSVDGRLLGLPGPYLWHMIGTFNICSWVPTTRSLTDIGRCYNLGGASFPHHTPWPSWPMVLRFPPKSPSRSQVKHPTITCWTKEEQTLNLVSESFHSTSTAIYHLSIALVTISHQGIG
jgi:hypothetical protein